jgi:hypothetical protein
MIDLRVAWQNLVHDILEINEKTEGLETACGMVLRATPDKMTLEPASCFQCISGEFEFQREVKALEMLKDSHDMRQVYVDRLKAHLTPKGE